MSKIERMTAEQEAYLPIYRAEWVAVGESIAQADPNEIRTAVRELYAATGLQEPAVIVMDSPLGCLIARALMSIRENNLSANLRDNLRANLRDNLGANLTANLRDNLGANLGANLRTSLAASLGTNLSANLRDNLGDNLGANLRDNLRDNLTANLWTSLGTNLSANLGANLGDSLGTNLGANLRTNLGDNLRDNLEANLGDNLWANLGTNLSDNLGDNLTANLWTNLGANLRDNLGDSLYTYASLWGAHDIGWLAFYDFPRILGHSYPARDSARLDATIKYARLCGWLYAYDGIAFVSQRQSELHRDERGRLHSDSRPAMAFADGYGFHAWHGIRIPAWCIEDKQRITKETILAKENTEIRRAMCEIVGWTRALEMLGGRTIHADECLGLPRKLIELDLRGERVRVLHMTNGTIENGERRQFVEGVPETIKTCHDAVAWQCGIPATVYNEGIRT